MHGDGSVDSHISRSKVRAKNPGKIIVDDEESKTEKDAGRPVMVDGVLFVPKYFFALVTEKAWCKPGDDGKPLCIIDMPIVK